MRQIKFRAWDKVEKRWLNSTECYIEANHGDIVRVRFRKNGETEKIIGDEDTVVSLSTGLLDSKGKEIYEGDILKHDLWGNCQIIWEHGMFRGQSEDKEYDFTLADYQRDRQKIIGNIYENPELLK